MKHKTLTENRIVITRDLRRMRIRARSEANILAEDHPDGRMTIHKNRWGACPVLRMTRAEFDVWCAEQLKRAHVEA